MARFETRRKNQDLKQKKRRKEDDSSSEEESDYESEELLTSDYETVDSDSDESYEPPKKSKKNKKRIVESDDEEDIDEEDIDEEDSDDEEYDDEDDEYEDVDEDEEDLSQKEIQKIISRIFPSKYMKNRANEDEEEEKTPKRSNRIANKKKKSKSKQQKKNKKSKRRKNESDDEESDDESEYEDIDEEDDEGAFEILLNIGGAGGGDEEDEYIDDDQDVDSDDEEMFMKENYEKNAMTKEETDKKVKKKDKKAKKDESKDDVVIKDVENDYLDMVDTKNHLKKQLHNKPNNKVMKKALKDCNRSIKKLVKKARSKNAKNYHKLINSGRKQTNEVDYFKRKLSNKQQLQVMRELKEINKHINIDKPYRLRLLDTNMPAKFKSVALQKLSLLRSMDPADNEYFKIKNWVDAFMKIPFGIYRTLDVKMEDGVDKCHDFMKNAMGTLNDCVYGLNDAKMQIMQMMGQWISNPSAMGTAIAIKGPMGTGKTTLVKDGISKILGREFAFIALGGTGDSSFLEGHSYTYEGSTWGKIAQILMDSKSMNPVIYFDELDKISDTPKGEEIIGILTHLTDTSQNSQFHDKYFSEVDFDLSKCLFIFSYNDESKVNPILKDRMYCIQTKGYESKEKITIAKNYLLPKIREQVNFNEGDIIIPDETLSHIISSEFLTKKESGVRNLKRCLEIIHNKLNLFRLIKPGEKLFDEDIDMEVSFPFTVSTTHVDKLIKNDTHQNQSLLAMYV